MPQVYIGLTCAFVFLFEIGLVHTTVKMLLSFVWAWIAIRLFNRTKGEVSVVGDATAAFALSTFMPERVRSPCDQMCALMWALADSCRLITKMQGCLLPRAPAPKEKPTSKPNSKPNSKSNPKLTDTKKAALKMLDDEINKHDEQKPLTETQEDF